MAIVFTAGGSAVANASLANLAAATTLYGKSSVSVATINGVSGLSNINLIGADDGTANSKFQVQIIKQSSTVFEAAIYGSNKDTTLHIGINFSALPASGDVIIAYSLEYVQLGIAVFTSTGTLLGSTTHNTGIDGGGQVPPGIVRINTPLIVHSGGAASAPGQWNGAALYSGTPYDTTFASASWFAAPTVGEANIVALWQMNDALSGTTPTSISAQVGSQPLALSASNFNWANDTGGWFPGFVGGRATFTSTGLADTVTSNATISALTVGSFALKFSVMCSAMGTNPKNHGLFQIDDGTDANSKISAYIKTPSAATWQIGFSIPGVGNFLSASFTQSQMTNPLPAFGAGNDVIGYFWWNNATPTHGVSLFDTSSGT